jgi:hypothetical protein
MQSEDSATVKAVVTMKAVVWHGIADVAVRRHRDGLVSGEPTSQGAAAAGRVRTAGR